MSEMELINQVFGTVRNLVDSVIKIPILNKFNTPIGVKVQSIVKNELMNNVEIQIYTQVGGKISNEVQKQLKNKGKGR